MLPNPAMKPDLASLFHRHRGWRLWLALTLLCIVVVEAIGITLGLLLVGRINPLMPLVGALVTAIVAPTFMVILNAVLSEARMREQRRVEEAARQAEHQLVAAMEATRLVFWDIDLSSNALRYDAASLPRLGLAAEDVPPATLDDWLKRLHPRDAEEFLSRFQLALRPGGPVFDFEYRFQTVGATWVWLHSRGRITHRAENGAPLRAAGTTINIDAQRQAVAELEANRALLNVTLQSTDEGILVVDAEGRVLTLNQRFLQLWRVPSELAKQGEDQALLDHVLDQLVEPAEFLAKVHALYGSDAEARDTLLFKDGRIFDRYTRGLAFGGARGRIWCFKDVTEQRGAEAALRDSEHKLLTILDNVDAYIYLKDTEGNYLFANRAVRRLWNAEMEDIVGKGDEAFFDAATAARIREVDRRVLRDGETARTEETNSMPGGAPAITYWSTKLPLRDADGNIHALCGISTDISARKQAEIELLAARNKFAAMLEALPDLLFELDADHRITAYHSPRTELLAAPAEHFLGRRHDEFLPPEAASQVSAALLEAARDGRSTGRQYWLDLPVGRRWFELSVQRESMPDPQAASFIVLARDITDRREMTDALRQREEYQRALLDNFPFMVWLKDRDSRFLAVNRFYADRVHAAAAHDLVGKSDLDYFPVELAQGYRADDRAVLDSGQPKNVEEEIEFDGRRAWFETYKSPVRVGGEVIGTVGFARDITDRKAAEAELESHRRHLEELVAERTAALLRTETRASYILQSSADGIYGVDAEGLVTFINPAGCELLGCRAEDVIGRLAHEVFHHTREDGTPYPYEECPVHVALQLGNVVRIDDEVFWHAGGDPIPVMYAVHPMVQDGRVIGAVTSFVDMREQREAADARERALIAAEDLARLRREFLANMSHEIRTPLNGVLGFAEIGQRNFDNAEKAKNAFAKILISGKTLLGVIDEILDFSKIEAGKLVLEHAAVDPRAVIEHAVETVRERARAKALQLRVDIAPEMPRDCGGDGQRLSQVLLNLLGNAVKFTESGGIVLGARRAGDRLLFSVADTGIGMTPEQVAQLFNPFQQADASTTRKFGGTGLGLAISKRILELMDGHIRVESTPGAGSRFEFDIPLLPAPATEPGAADDAGARQALRGFRVLVAEDDPINGILLEENLVERGARPTLVGNGREAVERLIADGRDAYDIVLMDIQMPEMDGYEATRRILELAPDLPVIGQTAHAFGEERDKCFAAGMVAHVAKPIDHRALTQLILRHAAPANKGTQ